MKAKKTEDKSLVLYGGTYLNKGGAAIAYGTVKVLSQLGIDYNVIIDPEPQFSHEFFSSHGLTTIYRYSSTLSTKPLKSINPISLLNPFVKCIIYSYKKQIKSLKNNPIWHIGDSPFSDYRTSLSIIGQVIAIYSLQKVVKGKVIIGGISLEFPRTKIGKYALKWYFKHVDYFFIRGIQTFNNLQKLGVPAEKMSMICDFAYHLDKKDSNKINSIHEFIKDSSKPCIALILRDFSSGYERQNYINNLKELICKMEVTHDILYVPTSYAYLIPENDLIFLEKTLDVDSKKIINIRDFEPEEIISILSVFDAVISTRLHGAVLGTLANVPTIHLYEGRKSLEVITDIFDEKTVPLVKLSSFSKDGGPNEIIQLINDLVLEKELISKNMKSCIHHARDKSLNELKKAFVEKKLLD